MINKKCTDCGEIKSIDLFYRNNNKSKNNEFSAHPECKECTKTRVKKWRKDNPEQQKALNNKRDRTPKRIKEKRLHSKKPESKAKQKEWRESNYGKSYMSDYGKRRNETKKHSISKIEWSSCKNYFNHKCAYCGLEIENHYVTYRGKQKLYDFSKDHFDDMGCNDLSNCVPSCRSCNSQKWTFDFNEWYIDSNEIFSLERSEKIRKWINEDYKIYI